jgi:hypothetical protein
VGPAAAEHRPATVEMPEICLFPSAGSPRHPRPASQLRQPNQRGFPHCLDDQRDGNFGGGSPGAADSNVEGHSDGADARVAEREDAQMLFASTETGWAAAGRTEEAGELDTPKAGSGDAGVHLLRTHLDDCAFFVPRMRQTCA